MFERMLEEPYVRMENQAVEISPSFSGVTVVFSKEDAQRVSQAKRQPKKIQETCLAPKRTLPIEVYFL